MPSRHGAFAPLRVGSAKSSPSTRTTIARCAAAGVAPEDDVVERHARHAAAVEELNRGAGFHVVAALRYRVERAPG
jgi:hypothetical protein